MKLTPGQARQVLAGLGIDESADFHTLSSNDLGEIVARAKAINYHKPRHANGSTARYFLAYLQRLARRAGD